VKRTLLLFFLPFIIFSFVSYIFFLKACDYAMSNQAQQLLPFNHKSHVTRYGASDCELCHGYYENGRFKGIPTIGTCKQCHDGNTAAEKAMFKNYQDNDKPWQSYARQPDLVYFSHTAVLKNTKAARCASCHGDRANSTTTARVKGVGRTKMPMGQCMDCHTALRISNKCLVCHD
jgi:hypothetical protein